MISPTERAPVCSGGQLELTCATTGSSLEWTFDAFRENATTANENYHVIPRAGSPGPSLPLLLINSTMFNFSKTSADGASPVMSRLWISPVSRYLNGTVINCVDLDTANISSTTVIVRERDSLQGIQLLYYITTWLKIFA